MPRCTSVVALPRSPTAPFRRKPSYVLIRLISQPKGTEIRIQFVDLLKTSVIGENSTFRSDVFSEAFNPTATAPPFFQVFDAAFLDILGPNPSLRSVSSDPTFAFAHEAPIWIPDTDEVAFSSNDGGALGRSDIDNNSIVSKLSLKDVEAAIAASNASAPTPVNVTFTPVSVSYSLRLTLCTYWSFNPAPSSTSPRQSK